nr:hypothetical protein [Tanacetum cinerariifolium]
SSSTPIYSSGSSTPPRYSLGALTPQSYSSGTSRNVEYSNYKHLLDNKTGSRKSQRNDQRDDKGSWIKRKLNNIHLKRLHDINKKIEFLESQQENPNEEEFKTRRLMNVRCYKCKEKGHFINNCPLWKKIGKAKIIQGEDKESVNHKPTIETLKPREPYTQVYQERIKISGDYLVLGTENGCWNDFWVQTIEEFIEFMEMMNIDRISYKHKDVFTRKFNDKLKWFHKAKAGKDLEGKLPPKILNVEICLFDFYNFVNNCGGYGKISQTGEWMEIAKYYGFPCYYDEDFKEIFEDYLLHPHTYYEFVIGRKPNKYTDELGTFEDQGESVKLNKYANGMGTFKDQAKGFADHFSTTIAVLISKKILKRYYMENSKRGSIIMQEKLRLSKSQGASTPAELKRMQNVSYASAVGSIMYAMRCTRPDVAFAQNVTSRFEQNPDDLHWTTVKNILKYLRNTKDMFLVYGGDLKRELRVSCYTDAGYLTDADDLKSVTGYVFILNGVVDWKSAKQSIIATSSAEAEYIAAFDASKEAVWVRKFIFRLGVVPTIKEPISMYYDNTRENAIANESGITEGARHFHDKVHYLREVIEYGDVKLEKVHIDDNLADPFTKALAFLKHSEHTRNIGILSASSLM